MRKVCQGKDLDEETSGIWGGFNALKMNFSVGVSIYRENVTSYW